MADMTREEATAALRSYAMEMTVPDLAVVKALLNAGADVNYMLPGLSYPSLLEVAVLQSMYDLAELAIEAGAEINHRNNIGESALHLAVEEDDAQIIDLLLHAHADMEIRDDEGNTPLLTACEGANMLALKRLMDAGANPHVCDYNRYSALHIAVINANYDIAQLLIEARVDVNRQNLFFEPPFFAADDDDGKWFDLFCAAGADMEYATPQGKQLLGMYLKSDLDVAAKHLLTQGFVIRPDDLNYKLAYDHHRTAKRRLDDWHHKDKPVHEVTPAVMIAAANCGCLHEFLQPDDWHGHHDALRKLTGKLPPLMVQKMLRNRHDIAEIINQPSPVIAGWDAALSDRLAPEIRSVA